MKNPLAEVCALRVLVFTVFMAFIYWPSTIIIFYICHKLASTNRGVCLKSVQSFLPTLPSSQQSGLWCAHSRLQGCHYGKAKFKAKINLKQQPQTFISLFRQKRNPVRLRVLIPPDGSAVHAKNNVPTDVYMHRNVRETAHSCV